MSKTAAVVHAIISCIGILLGIIGTIVFWNFQNPHATIWAFISAVFAAANFQLHLIRLLGSLEEWYNLVTLSSIKCLGFFTWVIAFAVMTWYIFFWLYFEVPVLPVSGSMIISAVWAFMTFKWGLMLHITANRYSREIGPEGRPILA